MKIQSAARIAASAKSALVGSTPCPLAIAAGALIAACASLALAPAAGAQDIGYLPAESPYRDIPYRQELTFFAGYYAPSADPVGVAPTSAPIGGVRYEIRLGGPAQFYASVAGSRTDRTVIDPTKAPEERVLGIQAVNLLFADVGIAANITGQKSWHGLVPTISGGLGVASDMTGKDPGGFRLGTPFALSMGGGLKWVSSGRLALRADVTDHFFQVRYPDSYYQPPATGVPPVREQAAKQNIWTHNAALTLGIVYQFGR